MAYREFLIKKGNELYSSNKTWDAWVTELPLAVMPDLKELPKNEWYDQSGDDEFIPNKWDEETQSYIPHPVYKAYEITVTFAIKGEGSLNELSPKVRAFIKWLAEAGEFTIYSDYSGVGRQKVRYVGYEDSAQFEEDGENSLIEFKVKLKVNDPITNIVPVRNIGGEIINLEIGEV